MESGRPQSGQPLDAEPSGTGVSGELVRELLDGHGVTAAYQPIVEIETKRIHGWEALLRARHPQLGDVSPVVLIEAAIQHDLLDELTIRIADEALMTVATAVMLAQEPLRLTVNIELEQLHPTSTVVEWLLANSAVGGVTLLLEVTERGADHWTAEHEATARVLHESGIQLGLDDYGAGSARLGFLHHRDWDLVKIDRQFLVYDTPRDRIVLNHFVRMLADLGIPRLAEGIESPRHFALATELGIEYAQGYWLGRPIRAETMLARLERDGLDLP